MRGRARQVSVGGLDEIGIITRDSDVTNTNAGGIIQRYNASTKVFEPQGTSVKLASRLALSSFGTTPADIQDWYIDGDQFKLRT
jgi:hypothetical protein